MQRESARIEKARAEFNFRSIEALIPRGSRVLDVGAWNCYLGQLLRDRMGCEVLSLDVVDANKTDMPFQVFRSETPWLQSAGCGSLELLPGSTASGPNGL